MLFVHFMLPAFFKSKLNIVYVEILVNDWFAVSLRASFLLWKRQIRFQTKMEDLSVEVYGENGAYYKVCKLWSTTELYINCVIFISDLLIQFYQAIVFKFCHILTKIFFREDHRGWNGRHGRLTGREFSMCFIRFAFLKGGVIMKTSCIRLYIFHVGPRIFFFYLFLAHYQVIGSSLIRNFSIFLGHCHRRTRQRGSSGLWKWVS